MVSLFPDQLSLDSKFGQMIGGVVIYVVIIDPRDNFA